MALALDLTLFTLFCVKMAQDFRDDLGQVFGDQTGAKAIRAFAMNPDGGAGGRVCVLTLGKQAGDETCQGVT